MATLDKLTPGQAKFVLERIVADKKIKSREIDKYLKEMDSEIENLEHRLSMLRGAGGAGAASDTGRSPRKRRGSAAGTASSDKRSKRKRGSRKATTPETQKSRQLQGQYISLIKRFSGKERDRFKILAKEQGREEAVKQMKQAAGQK